MTEIEMLKQDLIICEQELAHTEQRVLELTALQRRLAYDIAEAERELEQDYA